MNWLKLLILAFARVIIRKYGTVSWTRTPDNPDRVFRYPEKPGTNRERALKALETHIQEPVSPEAREIHNKLRRSVPQSNSGKPHNIKPPFTLQSFVPVKAVEQIVRTPDDESNLETNPFNRKNTVYPVFGNYKNTPPQNPSRRQPTAKERALAAFNDPEKVKAAAYAFNLTPGLPPESKETK